MSIKIDLKRLSKLNEQPEENFQKNFGDWISNKETIDKYKDTFQTNNPFSHCVIDNFLSEEYSEKLYENFPTLKANPDLHWHKYYNPIEVKYACDSLHDFNHVVQSYFYNLSSSIFLNTIKYITNIEDLEVDEYLHGAGVHLHPRRGRLNMHLDYEKHPYSGKQRRINIILFMNKNWIPSWNGANEFWNDTMTYCVKKNEIKFNRALIFKTNEISWHGLPEPLMCPEEVYRKSLAYYYVSPLISKSNNDKNGSNKDGYRTKACFKKRPQDKEDVGMNELYKIRPHRRLNSEDLKLHVPNWNVNTN